MHFAARIAASCCVVVSMVLVTRFSFERGTLRYVKLVEKERLETLARCLEQAYAELKRSGELQQWRQRMHLRTEQQAPDY